MLKSFRNRKVQKLIVGAIALATILSLVIWGVVKNDEDKKSASYDSALGTIDNKKFSVGDYLKSYQAVSHQVRFMYGDKANEILKFLNPRGQAWDRLVLTYHADKEKIKVSDSEVVDWIATQPLFNDRSGFATELYKRYIVQYLGTTTREFEEEMRGTLKIQKIREKIKDQIKLDDSKIKKLYQIRNKKNPKANYEENKEVFTNQVLEIKASKRMRPLLEDLRGRLKVNTEMMKLIFKDEIPATPVA